MEIDIRFDDNIVKKIKITDTSDDHYIAEHLKFYTLNKVMIEDSNSLDVSLRIGSKEHALNLIKGINKAIELGWVK